MTPRMIVLAAGGLLAGAFGVSLARRKSSASSKPSNGGGGGGGGGGGDANAPPRSLGIPFAPLAPSGARWPVAGVPSEKRTVPYVTSNGKTIGCGPCVFGAARTDSLGTRRHAAIDLDAGVGAKIVAISSGTIVGPVFGYQIGAGLEAVAVDHEGFSAIYAEIRLAPLARQKGAKFPAGSTLGTAALNGDGGIMLHFETWVRGRAPAAFTRWAGSSPPPYLLDPTRMLLALARTGG